MSGVVRQALTWCSRLSATVAGSQGGSCLRAASSRCGSSFPPPFPFPVCRDRSCRLACCKCTTPSGCKEGTPGLCRQRYAAVLTSGAPSLSCEGGVARPNRSRMRWACAVRYSVLCSESSLILCFLISCPPRKRGTACDERDGPVVPRGHARMPGAAAVCPSLSFAGDPRSRTGALVSASRLRRPEGAQFPTCFGLARSLRCAPPSPCRPFDGRGAFLELGSWPCLLVLLCCLAGLFRIAVV